MTRYKSQLHRVTEARRMAQVKALKAKNNSPARGGAQTAMQGALFNAHRKGTGAIGINALAVGTAVLAASEAKASEKIREAIAQDTEKEHNYLQDIVAPLGITALELALLFMAFRLNPIKPKETFRMDPYGGVTTYPKNEFPTKVNGKTWMDLIDELELRRDTPVDCEFKVKRDTNPESIKRYTLVGRNEVPKQINKRRRGIVVAALAALSVTSIVGLIALDTSPTENRENIVDAKKQEPGATEEYEGSLWFVPVLGALVCMAGAIPILQRKEKEGMALAIAEFLKKEESKVKNE